MIVTRTPDGGAVLGAPPEDPSRTALLEAEGAFLLWDVAAIAPLPHAVVWDVPRAAAWMWEIFGADATDALLGGRSEFAAEPGPSTAPARLAAHAAWATAWWPASAVAAIPPLDPRLLAHEYAAALADIEHLLDDDTAADRARVEAHATDAAVNRVDYALAAAGPVPDTPIATGTSPISLAAVPSATIDAAAVAHWSISREGAQTILRVHVDRAPRHPADTREPARIDADFAGTRLSLVADAAAYTGSVPVAATVLLARPEQRTLTLASPGFTARGDVDAGGLLDLARTRLARASDDPMSLRAEREAAW